MSLIIGKILISCLLLTLMRCLTATPIRVSYDLDSWRLIRTPNGWYLDRIAAVIFLLVFLPMIWDYS